MKIVMNDSWFTDLSSHTDASDDDDSESDHASDDDDSESEPLTDDGGVAQNTILFECTIYGRIHQLEVGPYGNWYPSKLDASSSRMTFPSRNLERAAHVVQLKIPDNILSSLRRIDNKIASTFNEDQDLHVPGANLQLH